MSSNPARICTRARCSAFCRAGSRSALAGIPQPKRPSPPAATPCSPSAATTTRRWPASTSLRFCLQRAAPPTSSPSPLNSSSASAAAGCRREALQAIQLFAKAAAAERLTAGLLARLRRDLSAPGATPSTTSPSSEHARTWAPAGAYASLRSGASQRIPDRRAGRPLRSASAGPQPSLPSMPTDTEFLPVESLWLLALTPNLSDEGRRRRHGADSSPAGPKEKGTAMLRTLRRTSLATVVAAALLLLPAVPVLAAPRLPHATVDRGVAVGSGASRGVARPSRPRLPVRGRLHGVRPSANQASDADENTRKGEGDPRRVGRRGRESPARRQL